MLTRRLNLFAAVPAALLIGVSAPACAPLSAMDDVIGSTTGRNTLYGEVRSVDTRRARLQLREQNGRDYTVRYDNRTEVVYGQRRYPPSALERGDVVSVRVQYDRNNNLWADRIDVRDSRSVGSSRDDRDRRDDRTWRNVVERYDGRVRSVDTRRGFFTLDRARGASLVVHVPRGARRDDIRRFERLRRNERVRVEVRLYGNSNQAELVRFR